MRKRRANKKPNGCCNRNTNMVFFFARVRVMHYFLILADAASVYGKKVVESGIVRKISTFFKRRLPPRPYKT